MPLERQLEFTTRCGGLFLFVADLVRLGTEPLARAAGFPGSQMIPAEHALSQDGACQERRA